MPKNIYSIGFMIFSIIIAFFLITYFFFRDANYYQNSLMVNAFVLPLVFAIGAYYSVTTYSRKKITMSFKEVFGRAFYPMFIGGLLSLGFIFVFLNFFDKDTKNLLNKQYIERYEQSLEEEYSSAKKIIKPNSSEMEELEKKYAEAKVRIAAKQAHREDMFSFKYFSLIFAGYCLYFLILSLFLASFFRSKSIE